MALNLPLATGLLLPCLRACSCLFALPVLAVFFRQPGQSACSSGDKAGYYWAAFADFVNELNEYNFNKGQSPQSALRTLFLPIFVLTVYHMSCCSAITNSGGGGGAGGTGNNGGVGGSGIVVVKCYSC